MMNRLKNKGQGALEYLLLIGGAVLIAVIVIALLVGMGGQSRDTAREQADKAQQVTDFPQAAHIVSVDANYAECKSSINGPTITSVNWTSMGGGGSHTLRVYDAVTNAPLVISTVGAGGTVNTSDDNKSIILVPTGTKVTSIKLQTNISTEKCGDSYFVVIQSEKNNQTVDSPRFRFHWK